MYIIVCMSGPISAIVIANPVAALLSAAAIRAAMAVADGYAEAASLREAQQDARAASREAQGAARMQGEQALAEQARRAETRFEALLAVAGQIGMAHQALATRPSPPACAEPHAVAAYVRALHALTEELRAIVLTEAARRLATLPALPQDIALPAAAPTTPSARLLARIAHLPEIPEDIARLAEELDSTLPGERAELLATEVRARIHEHLDALQQRQVREATALIVDQSLRDLGYQVEEIGSTLFVEGGVVHFRRQAWGDYMVRMRVNPGAGAVNFNVIRAVAAGSNERSVLDHLAEDRWCAEFPALLKALEARGVLLDVTRRLEAGELPVQLVDAGKLPAFADADAAAPRSQPLTRELK